MHVRSFAAQTPALLISVLALVLSLGGGAYAATHVGAGRSSGGHSATVRSNATGVTWTSLPLENGWASANATFGSGNPKVALQSGIVYFSGSLAQATPGATTFAVLPSQFRPEHNLWITVYTFGGSSGTLEITSGGDMSASSGSGGCGGETNAQCYTSLATVSYPLNS